MGAANIDLYSGDDKALELECLDGDGDPFDLTGYTVVVKAIWNKGKDEIELSGSDLDVDEVAGTIAFTLTGTHTDEMPEGRETKLLLLLTDPDGLLSTIRIGRIKVVDANG